MRLLIMSAFVINANCGSRTARHRSYVVHKKIYKIVSSMENCVVIMFQHTVRCFAPIHIRVINGKLRDDHVATYHFVPCSAPINTRPAYFPWSFLFLFSCFVRFFLFADPQTRQLVCGQERIVEEATGGGERRIAPTPRRLEILHIPWRGEYLPSPGGEYPPFPGA